jgi:hypothetical protein
LNEELTHLISSYTITYNHKAQAFHRVYLVTTEPFLGSLSYHDLDQWKLFRTHLETLSSLRAESIRQPSVNRYFEFHVVCGDAQSIKGFHQSFYSGSGKTPDEIARSAQRANDDIDRYNSMVKDAGGDGPFYRTNKIPPVQFMVIGNKLFEFTLESQGSMTEIFNTQVVHDTRFCKNYIETFDVFRQFVNNQHISSEAVQTH